MFNRQKSFRFIITGIALIAVTAFTFALTRGGFNLFGTASTEAKTEKAAMPLPAGVCNDVLPALSNIEVEDGTTNLGYATLAAAFTAINNGVHTGTITIDVCANTTEAAVPAAPSMSLNANGVGGAVYTTITISPAGGAGRTISGTSTAGFAMIQFDGADGVNINGLNASSNTLTIQNTLVSTTAATSTIRYVNDATGNIIQNATINGAATGASTGTIIYATTTGATGNDNNTITASNIGPVAATFPSNAIFSSGTTTSQATRNSGISITNNNIFDFFTNTAVIANGVLASGTTDMTITGNSFYQTATRTMSVAASGFIGISISDTSSINNTVSNNFIGGNTSSAGGTAWTQTGAVTHTFIGIRMSVGSSTASSLQNNVIRNLNISTSSASTINAGISAVTGAMNIGNTVGNTIGATTGTGSITWTGAGAGARFSGIQAGTGTPNGINISNNNVGSITIAGAGTNVFYGIRIESATAATAPYTVSGNTIGSTTTANSITSNSNTTFVGISGTNTGFPATVSNNTIRNLQHTSTGTSASLRGIELTGSISGQVISGNTIRDFSTTSTNTATLSGTAILAIFFSGTATTGNSITTNTMRDLVSTAATAAVTNQGIYIAGTPGTTISRNFFFNLTTASTSTTSQIMGIQMFNSAATITMQNNMMRLGTGVGNNPIIRGIVDNSAAGSPTNIYFNSILIDGTQGAATVNTACIYKIVTSTMNVTSNILWNNRASTGAPGAGTGRHYGIQTTAGNPVSNFNDIYTPNNGGAVGFSTADRITMTDWRTFTSQDLNSLNVDPLLVDPTNATTPDLHLQAGSPAINAAASVAGVTNDFDGENRPGGNALFDIGADERDGVTPAVNDIQATAFVNPTNGGVKAAGETFSPQASFTNNGTAAQTGVTVRYRICTDGTCTTELYNQTAVIASLASLATTTVTFPSTSVPAGVYTIKARAELAGDTVPANDEITGTFTAAAPLAGDYTVGTSLWSRVTGKTVTFEPRTRLVPQDAPIDEAAADKAKTANTEKSETSEKPAEIKSSYEAVKSANPTKIMVEETYMVPIIDGVEQTKPVYHEFTPEDKVNFGIESNLVGAYLRITDAVNDYNGRGVSGHTRFLLIDGAYNTGTGEVFPMVLSTATLSGPTAAATVTIQPSTGMTPTISGVSTSGMFVFADPFLKIDGDNVGGDVSRNLTINNTGTGASTYVIGFFNGGGTKIAKNGTVRYTNIRGGATVVSTVSWGIILNGAGGDYDDALIENNKIWQAFVGIGNYGVAATGINNNGIIRNNIIGDATGSNESIKSRGIEITQSDGLSITGNEIFGFAAGNANSQQAGVLQSTGSSNISITRNHIHDFFYNGAGGLGCFGIWISVSAGTLNINNNMIHNIKGDGDVFGTAGTNVHWMPAGILLAGNTGGTLNVDHNSVYMQGATLGSAFTGQSAAVSVLSGLTGINLRNNVLRNSMTTLGAPLAGNKTYAVAMVGTGAASTAFTVINNNDYFSNGTNPHVGFAGNADRTTLAAWQGATTQDGASIDLDPLFVSATDLHLTQNSPPNGIGAPLSITVDFDGDPRSATNPDMGADELVQFVGGSIPAGTYYNLMTFGGDTLTGDVTVTGRAWINGQLNTGTNTFTFGCNGTYTLGSSASFIVGNARKDFCAPQTFIFPVGESTGTAEYSPMTANVTAGTFPPAAATPPSLTVSVTDTWLPALLQATAVSRYWTVTEFGDLTADMTFEYVDPADVNGNEANYKVFKRAAGTTTEVTPNSNNPGANTATVTGVSSFSDWGIGALAVPTAANVNIGGRVTFADGISGVPGATITIAGGSLQHPVTLRANPFGYYNFENIPVGTYVLTVGAKQYTFMNPTLVIDAEDNVTEANFFANP